MNVLVYAGPGTTPDSVKHCLETLRLLLSPYYVVSSVKVETLKEQPWASKTAMLVIPGGADLPLCKNLNGSANKEIEKFVKRGGRYLGFCSGGYYGSARVEFEVGNPKMEVTGSRELKFFPGTARGSCFKGFCYQSDKGARAVTVNVNKDALPGLEDTVLNYHNGGGVFLNADKYPNTEILTTYAGPLDVEVDGPQASSILCKVGQGQALLTGTHPEFTADLLHESPDVPEFTAVIEALRDDNNRRLDFMKACLKKMNLKVNENEISRPSLTPLYLTSLNPGDCGKLINDLERNVGYQIQNIIDVGNDRFRIIKGINSLKQLEHKEGYEDPDIAIKDLILCDSTLPDRHSTPYFDMNSFVDHLKECARQERFSDSLEFGSNFMYAEVLTSTSTLMDNNPKFLKQLPNGFTVSGTIQVSGRGRSGNVWVNPVGVLPVSTFMKLPLDSPKSPIVFIQYLSSLAFVKAVLDYDEGYSIIPIRIKWPNDVYILLPEYIGCAIPQDSDEVTHVKIGGVLVNTNIVNGEYNLVVGSGLNLSNTAPTTSVNLIIDEMNKKLGTRLQKITTEKFLAKYLTEFNLMFNKFKMNGFGPFMDFYYKVWMHTDQIVHIHHKGNVRCKIAGITSDWGLLLAKEIDFRGNFTGSTFELQPDGNSFDMFKGLISKKK